MDYKINPHKRPVCLECGHEINYGRVDKKFCCERCKNLYHNKQQKDSRSVHRKVMRGLEKNYDILNRLHRTNITSIGIGDLLAMGFRPEYSTSYRKVHSHDEFRCFEFKYYMSTTRLFNLKKVLSSI